MLALLLLLACQNAWDGSFAEGVARPEHPRPGLRRDSFINLNTWEAPLSGLGELPERYSPAWTAAAHTYRGVAWYRLALPKQLPPGDEWWVVFGAVDFDATVFVDGVEVAHHRGGYTPFSANLSAAANGAAPPVITVRVDDGAELNDRAQPVGKQGGAWYTRVSGLWQTVYLEQRRQDHLTSLRVVPEGEAVALSWASTGDAQASATVTLVALDDVRPWSPERPTLYVDMASANTAGFAGRTYFEETLREVVARDASHPSLMLWTVFNENWGLSANGSLMAPTPLADDADLQGWGREMTDLTASLDPHHPVEDNSAGGIVGAFEHVGGDSNSFHWYEDDPAS